MVDTGVVRAEQLRGRASCEQVVMGAETGGEAGAGVSSLQRLY